MGNQPFCLTVAATGGTVQLEIPETYRGTIILSKPHAPVLDLSPGICEHLSVSKAEFWDKTSTELVITNKPDCVDGAHAPLPQGCVTPLTKRYGRCTT